jgi:hypothetical protein
MLTSESVAKVVQPLNVTKFIVPDAEFLEKYLWLSTFSV